MVDSDLEILLRIINKENKTYGNIILEDNYSDSFFIEYINKDIDRIVLFKWEYLKYIDVNNTFYLIKHEKIKYSSIVSCLKGDFHLFSLPELRGKSNIINNFIKNILPHYKNINEKKNNSMCSITFKEKKLAKKINSLIKIDEVSYDSKRHVFLYRIKFKNINNNKDKETMNTDFLDNIIKLDIKQSSYIIKDFISSYGKISTSRNPPNILTEKLKNIYNKNIINDYFKTKKEFTLRKINQVNYNIKNSKYLSTGKENIENIQIIKINDLEKIFKKNGEKISIKEIRKNLCRITEEYIKPSDILFACKDSGVNLYINHRKKDDFPSNEINIDNIITTISLKKLLYLYINLINEEKLETANIFRIVNEFKINNKDVKLLNLPSLVNLLNMNNVENINEKILLSLKPNKCFTLIELDYDNFYEKIIINLEKVY